MKRSVRKNWLGLCALGFVLGSCASASAQTNAELGRAAPPGRNRTARSGEETGIRPAQEESPTTREASERAALRALRSQENTEPYAPELRQPRTDGASEGSTEGGGGNVDGAAVGVLEDSAGALATLFTELERVQTGTPGARFAMVQLGDSHTESDEFTSVLRRRFSERFGNAGRGFVPVAGGQLDVTRELRGPWTVERARLRGGTGPYGMGFSRARATDTRAEFRVATCRSCPAGASVSRFQVFFRRLPNAGSLEWRTDDGAWQRVQTAGDAATEPAAMVSIPVTDGAHSLTVRPAGDGPIELYGVAMDRERPGIQLDSAGVIGAQASHLDAEDWTVLSAQLAARAPKVVLLWYGTNECAATRLDPSRFERALTSVLTRVRTAVPGAAVVVLGPPDLALRGPGDTRNPPPRQLEIVDAARRAARSSGAVFIDLLAAMGGPGSIVSWVQQTPPLAWRDHVHLTAAGYRALAEQVFEEVAQRYEQWRTTRTRM